MALQNFGPKASAAEVAAATLQDGAAVVSDLVSTGLAETIAGELRDNFDKHGYRSKREFAGFKTNRCHHVLEEAPSSIALIEHDMVMDVTDVVPGSHRHITMGEQVDLSRCEQAVMSKGSVLFYLGSTMHGAGANSSDEARMGVITVYSLGWLRQEANQYLNIPFELARTYDKRMRCLLGYTTHDIKGDRLGKYYGSDTSFIDKDSYARNYRPYRPDSKGEE